MIFYLSGYWTYFFFFKRSAESVEWHCKGKCCSCRLVHHQHHSWLHTGLNSCIQMSITNAR